MVARHVRVMTGRVARHPRVVAGRVVNARHMGVTAWAAGKSRMAGHGRGMPETAARGSRMRELRMSERRLAECRMIEAAAVAQGSETSVELRAVEPASESAAVKSAAESTASHSTVEPAAEAATTVEASAGTGQRQAGNHDKCGRRANARRYENRSVVHVHSPSFRVGSPPFDNA
jgi:hypothetical protein